MIKDLKHFIIIINNGDFDTVFGLFKRFSEDGLFCPIYNIIKSCICTIGNINNNIKKEFGLPLCSITNEDINKGNIALCSAFNNTCKSYLKFCTICNKKGMPY